MQDSFFPRTDHKPQNTPAMPGNHPGEDLARIFNTALLATRAETTAPVSKEIQALVGSPAFQAILDATRTLAAREGISLKIAAQKLIETFRRADQLWQDYVFLEGIERLKGKK